MKKGTEPNDELYELAVFARKARGGKQTMKPTKEEIKKASKDCSDDLFEQVAFREGANFVLDQIGDGWISVEERLPENSDMVLVFNGTDMDFGVYSDGWILYFDHLRSVRKWLVTHWQPLPQKPRQ